MHISHIIAEIECSIIGHEIPNRKNTPRPAYIYPDGDIENMGDFICDNCGHFIKIGVSKVRNLKSINITETTVK
jgi:hypothetical protein